MRRLAQIIAVVASLAMGEALAAQNATAPSRTIAITGGRLLTGEPRDNRKRSAADC